MLNKSQAPSQCILPILHSDEGLCCFRGLGRLPNKLSTENGIPETAGHAETQLEIFIMMLEVVLLEPAVIRWKTALQLAMNVGQG